MKNRKRQGPKTEPWGTPEETLIIFVILYDKNRKPPKENMVLDE